MDKKDEETSKKGKKKLTRSLQLVFLRQYAAGSLIKGNRVTLKTELKRKRKIKKGEKKKKTRTSAQSLKLVFFR